MKEVFNYLVISKDDENCRKKLEDCTLFEFQQVNIRVVVLDYDR